MMRMLRELLRVLLRELLRVLLRELLRVLLRELLRVLRWHGDVERLLGRQRSRRLGRLHGGRGGRVRHNSLASGSASRE